jgi:DNA repair ATPase RecN
MAEKGNSMCEELTTRYAYDQQISQVEEQIRKQQQKVHDVSAMTGNNASQIRQEEQTLQVMEETLEGLKIKRNQCTY